MVNFNILLYVAFCNNCQWARGWFLVKISNLIRLGSRGLSVVDIQRRLRKLNYVIDDNEFDFGKSTETAIKRFQQNRGLLVDGIVGPETWQDLNEASYSVGNRILSLKKPYLRGDDIKKIQLWLRILGFNPGPIDGIFGLLTDSAVKDFQLNSGIDNDGIIGEDTITAFLNVRKIFEENETIELPHYEMPSYSSLSSLEGQKILIDFGHGGSDKGAIGPSGLEESIVCEDIGTRVGNLFKILGTEISYTRECAQLKSMPERVKLINNSNAAFVLSIHLNHSNEQKAEGSSCYYFSSGKISSTEGKKIANLLQKEQVESLNTKDCRIHGKKFNILRMTKIPAVITEPAFITNAKEEKLLRNEDYRQKIATAIFDGLQHYLRER